MMVAHKMVAHKLPEYITPEAYLALESEAEYKSEYHNGDIVAMSGASPNHNKIVFNTGIRLGMQMIGSSCRGFGSDQRVHVPPCNTYYYPDLTIVCGQEQYHKTGGLESLLNPTVIVEVLSPSTERLDRGAKFRCYRTLESLQMYVLVTQDSPLVEVFTRQADNSWRLDAWSSLSDVVAFAAVGCQVKMSEMYDGVVFPPALSLTAEDDAAGETA